jgi:hypothetical protein
MAKSAKTGEWGYVNIKGEWIIPAQYSRCESFTEDGLAAIYDTRVRQFFYINIKGEILGTGFKMMDVSGAHTTDFNSGLAPITLDGQKWGYINTRGRLNIPFKYEKANEFSQGFAAVKLAGNWNVINTRGEEFAAPPQTRILYPYSEGLAQFRDDLNQIGYLDTLGKIAIPAKFIATGHFIDGLAWAKDINGLVGYIGTNGDWVIKPRFELGRDFDAESKLARVKSGERNAYVNKSGVLVEIPDTERWGDFSNGLALGRKSNGFGFFDNEGKWVIPPALEGAREFKNGYAAVRKDHLWGIIDKTGHWIIPPIFGAVKDVVLIK